MHDNDDDDDGDRELTDCEHRGPRVWELGRGVELSCSCKDPAGSVALVCGCSKSCQAKAN